MTSRELQFSEDDVERAAKALAGLGPRESWPDIFITSTAVDTFREEARTVAAALNMEATP